MIKQQYRHYLEEMTRRAEKGNIHIHLGGIYLHNLEWGKAIATIEKGIRLGGIDCYNFAYRLLGDAYKMAGNNKMSREYIQLSDSHKVV